MAPTKRGAAPEDAPRKKQKHFDASDAPKRQHPANLKAVRDSSNRTPSNQEKKVSTRPSVLQTEERAFPRGGASVLTPLEHKQIQIQATRDVLFEQNGGSKPGPASDEEENAEQDTAITRPASKKRKRNKFDKQEDTQQDAPGVKIEGLSYKVRMLLLFSAYGEAYNL